jgi:hypothetical protein
VRNPYHPGVRFTLIDVPGRPVCEIVRPYDRKKVWVRTVDTKQEFVLTTKAIDEGKLGLSLAFYRIAKGVE